jgi:TPR repeat protein
MGWMYYTGKGMERNLVKAEDWFNKAAAKHADASFYLGEIHLGQEHGSGASPSPSPRNQPQKKSPKHMNTAIQYFVQATQRGHPLAAHRIAQMSAIGKGLQKVCHEALIGYKSSAERGDWAASLTTAHRLYDAGDRLGALRLFTRMAAVGVESAQFNAALILSRMTCSQGLVYNPPLHPDMTATSQGNTVEVHVGRDGDPITEESDGYFGSSSRDDVRINTAKVVRLHPSNWTSALTNSSEDVSDGIIDVSSVSLGRANCELRGMFLLGLSAQQQNAEAYLRVGDIHYYGSAGMARDKVEAAVYYQMAADLRHTHAIFNLGIMHEAGDGVQQDFHLAKRFYDQAAMVDTEARLPRAFALALLESHKSLHEMLGPDVAEMFLARPISWLQTLCASLGRNTFTGSGDNVLVDKGVGGNRSRGVSAVIADLMQFVRSDILGYTDDALESQYYTEKGPLADLDSDISDDSDGALHKIKTLYYYAVRLVDSLVHAVVWKDINPFGAWQPGISITVGNPTPDSAKDVGWLEEEQQTQSSGPLASIRNFDINDTESTSYSVVLIILILVMVMVYQLRAARIRRRRDAWDRQRQEMLLRE